MSEILRKDPPDVFNSKTARVTLELPGYAYSHSSSAENKTKSFFLGRKKLVARLKSLIISTSSKTGVYLVAGNRGVGKSSLVEKVIDDTSLAINKRRKYSFFLLVTLFLVLLLQYITADQNFYVVLQYVIGQRLYDFVTCKLSEYHMPFLLIINSILFILIVNRSYLKETSKVINTRKYDFFCVIWQFWDVIWRFTKAAFKEIFLLLPNSSNPFLRTQNVRKLIFILISCHIFAEQEHLNLTHLQVFLVYLCIILGGAFSEYLFKTYMKNYEENKSIFEHCKKHSFKFLKCCRGFFLVIFTIIFAIASVSLINFLNDIEWIKFIKFIEFIGWIVLFTFIYSCCFLFPLFHLNLILSSLWRCLKSLISKKFDKSQSLLLLQDNLLKLIKIIKKSFKELIKLLLNNYTKNCNRIYLKINFGHDVLKERDILRLITRTLSTEYDNFCRSWKHTFHWRILSLVIILFTSYLFYQNIYIRNLDPLMENIQIRFLNDEDQNKRKHLAFKKKLDSLKNFRTEHFSEYMEKDAEQDYIIQNPKIGYIIQIDKAINWIWCCIYNAPEYFWNKRPNGGKYPFNYRLSPINYAGLLIFLIFFLLGKLLLRSKLFTTHYAIKKQLKLLNEAITYSVKHEIGAGTSYNGILNIGINAKKKKSRLIADEREIEKELQDILANIHKIPAFMARPEFVIIFDELDKVSPELPNKEEVAQEGETKETMFAKNSTRERQALILKLLSNMKYFLSTAYAKFIFIAGREMYDMYLADIADRNNYFGSIFNDVIFVPSFLSDNDRQHDITTLTEEFVCRHLLPENYPTIEWNLNTYKKHLDFYFGINIKREKKTIYEREANRRIQKIIATLQQFIIYLSHTSKGAPKKMVQVFESFIAIAENKFDYGLLVVRQFKRTYFFLSFDYYQQFTIGMTSYLVSPIFHRLRDANIQQHSDKLLVSTLHFVDYMLKFHSQNFLWRQLDISPEVIETSHSPELKTIINNVVTLCEHIHFTKPIINLFDFKFDSLLSEEISFISKMDERFSAQFSFSLDESLALKQYYSNLLKRKQIEYKEFKNYGENFVSSISSLQIVLGELHFLDDELEEAALYYKDGIHLLHKKLSEDKKSGDDKNIENLEIFYLLIRNQLKLAYLYEKREQPEFAYLLYSEIVKTIIKARDYVEDSICKNQFSAEAHQIMHKNMAPDGLQLLYLPLLAKLQILEKRRNSIGILDHDIKLAEEEFDFLFSAIKHEDIKIIKADFYSKIGNILYYKNKIISRKNIKILEEDKKIPKGIEISHYACKYYKKALIALVLESDEESEYERFREKTIMQILSERPEFIYEKTNAKYCSVMAQVLSDLGDVYFSAKEEMCAGCEYEYGCKLKKGSCVKEGKNPGKADSFWDNWYELFNNNKFELGEFLSKLEKNPLNNVELALFLYSLSIKFYKKANLYKQSAFQITKILNCFKYCLKHKFHIHREELKKIYERGKSKDVVKPEEAAKPEEAVNLEYIAESAIEFLYTANDGLNMFEILKRKKDFDGEAHLQYIQVDSEISRVVVLQKELELRLCDPDPQKPNEKLEKPSEKLEKLNEMYNNYIISPYCINYSVSARVYQLNLKARLNWESYRAIRDDILSEIKLKESGIEENMKKYKKIYFEIFPILITNDSKWKNAHKIFSGIDEIEKSEKNMFATFELLIADSIFCYIDTLRLIETSDDSYIFNHRFFAEVYRRLTEWTEMYEVFKHLRESEEKDSSEESLISKFAQCYTVDNNKVSTAEINAAEKYLKKNRIDEYLKKLLGKDFREQISSYYYRQKAFTNYYKSMEMHSGGRAYFNLLEQMYFVKGDYDDDASHFNVAVERFMINNTNGYDEYLKNLKGINEESSLYKIDNYFEKPKT
jgi:hypothetical protein